MKGDNLGSWQQVNQNCNEVFLVLVVAMGADYLRLVLTSHP